MSSRKPPSNPSDWDDFDIPSWDESAPDVPTRNYPASSSRSRSKSRGSYPDPLYDDYENPTYPTRDSGRSAPSSQQPPRLSSRVPTRTTRPSQQDPYRDPYSSAEDAYAEAPYYASSASYDTPPYAEPAYPSQQRSAASQYDLYADSALDAGWDEAAVYDTPASRRRSRSKSRAARPSVALPRPAISDHGVVAVVGAGLLSLLLMIASVWYGLGNLGSSIPWHVNASGDVDHWATDSTLWRIPFGSLMALLIGLALGAYLWRRDRFAARFVITSMCVIQILAWVAVIDQLW